YFARGSVERQRWEGVPDSFQGGLLSRPARGQPAGLPQRGLPHPGRFLRHDAGRPPPRSRDRGSVRDRYAVRRTRADGRQCRHLSIRDEDGRPQDGHDGDVHAEADLWRQRERDARPPEPLDERQEHDVRPEGRVRGDQPDLPLLYRRADGPRPQPVRVHEPDNELVALARTRLRSPCNDRRVETQPERKDTDPDVLARDPVTTAERISTRGAVLKTVA